MMSRYFEDVTTLEQLRQQYKELLKQYHPDNENGNTGITQAINAEYDTLFTMLKDRHDRADTSSTDSKASYYNDMKYNFEEDELLREMLNKIIAFDGLNIAIVGNWVWLDGNTYPYKNELKELGFKWAREKKKWYWHSEAFRKRSRKKLSFNDICNYYGCSNVRMDRELLEA